MSKKKKTRRGRSNYPNLKPELNLKTRYEEIDYDYLDKLSPEELEWLNKFSGEYINAGLSKLGDNEDDMHATTEDRKLCTDKNNARNRCILTREKAMGTISFIEDLKYSLYKGDTEDIILAKIALNKKFGNSDEYSDYDGDDTE